MELNDQQLEALQGGLKDHTGSRFPPQSLDFKIPLVHNGHSIHVINEHHGQVLYLKWSQNQKMLATGGHKDNYVDVWNLTNIGGGLDPHALNNMMITSSSSPKNLRPLLQLRHIPIQNSPDDHQGPERSDESHYITSIQWSHSGDKLLTCASDNIARVWTMQGKLIGLFMPQNQLILSCWNKSDTFVATGGDETNILVWKPNQINKDPEFTLNQPGQIIEIAW